jgi:hypothetical protein
LGARDPKVVAGVAGLTLVGARRGVEDLEHQGRAGKDVEACVDHRVLRVERLVVREDLDEPALIVRLLLGEIVRIDEPRLVVPVHEEAEVGRVVRVRVEALVLDDERNARDRALQLGDPSIDDEFCQ